MTRRAVLNPQECNGVGSIQQLHALAFQSLFSPGGEISAYRLADAWQRLP
jgi:hypothetical protein